MTTYHHTPEQAIAHVATLLSTPPSEGLRRMISDVMASGLPIRFGVLPQSTAGEAQLRQEGIEIRLADVAVDEGVVAQPLARAILEMRGWPVIFAGETQEFWVGRLQAQLANMLENVSAVAVQQEYGIAYEAHEKDLLARQEQSFADLHRHAATLAGMDLTGEQEVEYGVGIALQVLERFWRTNAVPADFWNALDLLPGSRALFDSLSEFVPAKMPTTGWPVRQLMGGMIERIDDFMEIKGGVRPMMVLTHFVPALAPEDANEALGNVARVVMVPLDSEVPNEHSILVLPHRDMLPFGFRQGFADETALKDFADRLLHTRYEDFCRGLVPSSFLLWQPTGEALKAEEPAVSAN